MQILISDVQEHSLCRPKGSLSAIVIPLIETVQVYSSMPNTVVATNAHSTFAPFRQFIFSCALLCLLFAFCFMPKTPAEDAEQVQGVSSSEPGWVSMPAGARSAYFGIHGGTVPVSLLVTNTGTSLISFVGQTGNDFLALLRKAELRLPSFLCGGKASADLPLGKNHPDSKTLTCGSSVFNLPVISLSDDSVFKLAATPGLLQPFGFSDKTRGIEGDVSMPGDEAGLVRYHILVDPNYLAPHQE